MKFLETIFTPAAMAIMYVGNVNARIGSDGNQRELSESGREPTNFITYWQGDDIKIIVVVLAFTTLLTSSLP